MIKPRKRLFRAATQLREALLQRNKQEPSLHLPVSSWQTAQSLVAKIDRAHARGWNQAAASLLERLCFELEYCRDRLNDLAASLRLPIQHPVPTAHEFIHDILALEQEFEEVCVDLQKAEISVTTEPVVLERVHLGPFQICLELKRTFASSPYRIVALDPNPAGSNSAVTHPHVQDESLCEGEGSRAIKAALEQGRLLDFFVIVNRLLHTYGSGSAFVELCSWSGEPCQDCGRMTGNDDRSYCDRCDEVLCDGCLNSCDDCLSGFCAECIGSCPICDGAYCSGCLTNCRVCTTPVCDDCLSQGVCKTCHEQETECPDEAEAVPAVQSHGLGQTALSP